MKMVVITVLACLVVVLVGGLAFVYSGIYDVAATSPHGPMAEWLLETARDASVELRAEEIEPPPLADAELRDRGFRLYHEMCVTCHAAPGIRASEVGSGLYPAPPNLAEEEAEEPAELFWIVKNGFMDTGMPAFGPTHDDEQIWALVSFLQELPELSAEEYHRRADAAGLQVTPDHEHGTGS